MTHCHSTDALSCLEATLEDGTELEAIVKENAAEKAGPHHCATAARVGRAGDADRGQRGSAIPRSGGSCARRGDSIAADGSVINKIGNERPGGQRPRAGRAGGGRGPDDQAPSGHDDGPHRRDRNARRNGGPVGRGTGGDHRHGRASDEAGLTVENPAFDDVTPPRYVDAIVTERGQFPPESIVTLMRELFGEPTDDPWDA